MIMGIIILFIILLPILIILIGYRIDRENNKINVQTSNGDHNNISHMITTSNTSTSIENNNKNNKTTVSKSNNHSNKSLISTGSTGVESNNTNIDKPNKDLIILNGLYFGANYKKDAIKYSDCVKRLILEILVCIDKPDYDYNYLYIDITSTPTLDEDIFLHLVKADLIRCEKITIPVKKDKYGFIERRARTYLLIGITKKGREFAYQ